MALIPPQWLDSVVAIGFPDGSGGISFGATGFIYAKAEPKAPGQDQQLYSFWFVTNRHVVLGQKQATLRFNPPPGSPARTYLLDLVDGSGRELWTGHADPDIDVTVTPIDIQKLRADKIQLAYFHDDREVLFHSNAAAAGLSEGDSVFVLGFPMGQTGGERNYVVVRGGCVARVRDSLAGAAKTFLVDAAIFPGNSGGPVLTKPEVLGISGTKVLNAAHLIGIVQGYLPYEDVAYSRQTGRARVTFEENSGLAVVIPIDRVQETVERAMATPGKGAV